MRNIVQLAVLSVCLFPCLHAGSVVEDQRPSKTDSTGIVPREPHQDTTGVDSVISGRIGVKCSLYSGNRGAVTDFTITDLESGDSYNLNFAEYPADTRYPQPDQMVTIVGRLVGREIYVKGYR